LAFKAHGAAVAAALMELFHRESPHGLHLTNWLSVEWP
jgi:hypothetical protein